MQVLTVQRVCAECGEKLPHAVKQIQFAKQNIAEIEDLGLVILQKFLLM